MTDDELYLGGAGGRNHRPAFAKRNRHRFFDQHMFAGLDRKRGMLSVELMGCCDIDHIDGAIIAEILHGRVGLGAELSRKLLSRFGALLRRCDEGDPWIAPEGRQHHGKAASEPSHPDL
jgi:hypothetical protein